MIAVAGNAEGASSEDRDVVRLGRVRDALPVLGERVLVRELGHVGRRAIDVRKIVVLHQHDDELVEVARGLRRQVSRPRDRPGSGDRNEPRSEQRHDDEKDGGQSGAEGSLHVGPTMSSEKTSGIANGGGCGQPEGGIRAPAKGTSPDLGRGYIRTRSRLSKVVAAMRNSLVRENGKRTENSTEDREATDHTTRFLPLPPLRIPASGSEVPGEPAGAGGDRDRSGRSSRRRGPR